MGNFIVYKHTSPSGKCYAGITSQAPECRWGNDGCKYLEIHKNGKLKHPYFAQTILKYGWDNIKHELLLHMEFLRRNYLVDLYDEANPD